MASYDNMYRKTIFAFAAIAASVAMMVGMTTVPYSLTAVADKGGIPDDSARTGPACENAFERQSMFQDRIEDSDDDDSANNGNGAEQSYESVFENGNGIEPKKKGKC
jgi:hypothetical protein